MYKEEPHIGYQLTVHYDPNEPATYALIDFADLKDESFGPLPLLFFGIGGVAYIIIYWRHRGNPMKPSHQK